MYNLKKLEGEINASRTLNQLRKIVPISQVDGLSMSSTKSISEASIPSSEKPDTREYIPPAKNVGKLSMKNRLHR